MDNELIISLLIKRYNQALAELKARGIQVWDKQRELDEIKENYEAAHQPPAVVVPSPEVTTMVATWYPNEMTPTMDNANDDLGQANIGDEIITTEEDVDDDKGNTNIRGKRAKESEHDD